MSIRLPSVPLAGRLSPRHWTYRLVSRTAQRSLVAALVLGFAASCTSRLANFEPGTTDETDETDTNGEGSSTGADATTWPDPMPDAGPGELHCTNDERDGDEAATDCGGDDCPKCGLGQTCSRNSDCESDLCNGTCLASGCGNSVKDGSETDVDCGGSCNPCEDGAQCMVGAHCQSGVCEQGFCLAPQCGDSVRNGNETDTDCGGDECDACENGDACQANGDCQSDFCASGTCVAPECGDDSKNGDESDLDCGGSCSPCAEGRACLTHDDCESRRCDDGTLLCLAASCEDDVQNGAESDVDCGGDCMPCADGLQCTAAADCLNQVCDAELLTCSEPACDDEVNNGDESGIDCGGDSECGACGLEQGCSAHADCLSGFCNGVCQQPTCDDGFQNQDETEVDCGGDACVGCKPGQSCEDGNDCLSNDCVDLTCRPSGAEGLCEVNEDCITGRCSDGSCEQGYGGDGCYQPSDCVSSCSSGTCSLGVTGDACEVDAQCRSDHCKGDDTCGRGALGTTCSGDLDCVSNNCGSGLCQPTRLSIQTASPDPSDVVSLQMRIKATAGDLGLPWGQLAFLYFFTPETRSDFTYAQYTSPEVGPLLSYQITAGQWMLAWRAHPSNATPVPTSETFIDFRLLNEGGGSFNHTNDYSYVAGGGVNERIVICQNTEGRWKHIQTPAPSWAPDPCQYIVNSCDNSTAQECDEL